jgi:hypothetical protein
MKKFGDVVTYVKNGEPINALVAQSSQQPDGEHLTIVFLDPSLASLIMGGTAVDHATAKAFVVPLKEGSKNGWSESQPADIAKPLISANALKEILDEFEKAKDENSALQEKLAALEAEAAVKRVDNGEDLVPLHSLTETKMVPRAEAEAAYAKFNKAVAAGGENVEVHHVKPQESPDGGEYASGTGPSLPDNLTGQPAEEPKVE